MRVFKLILPITVLFFASALFAQTMTVTVDVKDSNGDPVQNATLVINNIVVGKTDKKGQFTLLASPKESILVDAVGFNNEIVDIEGRSDLCIVVHPRSMDIEQVEVSTQHKKINTLVFEPSDIEFVNGQFVLNTRYKIPTPLFNSNRRLIMQPAIVNATDNEELFMRPMVIDGEKYNISQDRMYGFDMTKDPLNKFIVVESDKTLKNTHIVTYRDSLEIADTKKDYYAKVYLTVEDYNKVRKYDTLIIAKGVLNHIRFLDYCFAPMSITSGSNIPEPELRPFVDSGEAKISFKTGGRTIDTDDILNEIELRKITDRLASLKNDDVMSIKSISILGTASPEGNSKINIALANARAQEILNRVTEILPKETLDQISLKSSSQVMDWNKIAELMDADGRTEESAIIRNTIKNNKSVIKQNVLMKKTKVYKIAAEEYFPRLRSVFYTIEYAVTRPLNDDEIEELYKTSPEMMSRYNYYRLISTSKDDKRILKLSAEAMKLFPTFLYAANEYVAAKLRLEPVCNNIEMALSKTSTTTKKSDELMPVLDAFSITGASEYEVIWNQILAAIRDNKIDDAAQLYQTLGRYVDKDGTMGVIISAIQGDYKNAYEMAQPMGGLNEVLMVIALKQYNYAYKKLLKMGTSPVVLYLRAITANQLDNISDAMTSMKAAIEADPRLREIARVDAMAIDLLNLIEPKQ